MILTFVLIVTGFCLFFAIAGSLLEWWYSRQGYGAMSDDWSPKFEATHRELMRRDRERRARR